MTSLGLIPYPPPPIAESQRYIKSEIDKWGGLVKSLGLARDIRPPQAAAIRHRLYPLVGLPVYKRPQTA